MSSPLSASLPRSSRRSMSTAATNWESSEGCCSADTCGRAGGAKMGRQAEGTHRVSGIMLKRGVAAVA